MDTDQLQSKISSKELSGSAFLLSQRTCLTSMVQHEERQKLRKKREVILPSTTLGERRKDTSYSTLNRLKVAEKSYLNSIRAVFDDQNQKYLIKSIHNPKQSIPTKYQDYQNDGQNSPQVSKTTKHSMRNRINIFLDQISELANRKYQNPVKQSPSGKQSSTEITQVVQDHQNSNENGGDHIVKLEKELNNQFAYQQQSDHDIFRNNTLINSQTQSDHLGFQLNNQIIKQKSNYQQKLSHSNQKNGNKVCDQFVSLSMDSNYNETKPTQQIKEVSNKNIQMSSPKFPQICLNQEQEQKQTQVSKLIVKQKQLQMDSRKSQELKQLRRFIDFQKLKLKPYFIVSKKEKAMQVNYSSYDTKERKLSRSSGIKPFESLESQKLTGGSKIKNIDQIIECDQLLQQVANNNNQIFIQEQQINQLISNSVENPLLIPEMQMQASQVDQKQNFQAPIKNDTQFVKHSDGPTHEKTKLQKLETAIPSYLMANKQQQTRLKNNGSHLVNNNPESQSALVSLDKSIRTLEIPSKSHLMKTYLKMRSVRKGKSLEIKQLRHEIKKKANQTRQLNISPIKKIQQPSNAGSQKSSYLVQQKKSHTAQNFYRPQMNIREIEYQGPIASNSFEKLQEYKEIKWSEMQYQSSHHKSRTNSEQIKRMSDFGQQFVINANIQLPSSRLLVEPDQQFPKSGSKSAKIFSNQPTDQNNYVNYLATSKKQQCSSAKTQQQLNRFEENKNKQIFYSPERKFINIEINNKQVLKSVLKSNDPNHIDVQPSSTSQKMMKLNRSQIDMGEVDNQIETQEYELKNNKDTASLDAYSEKIALSNSNMPNKSQSKVVLSKYSSTINNEHLTFNKSNKDSSFKAPIQEQFHTFINNNPSKYPQKSDQVYDSNQVCQANQSNDQKLNTQSQRFIKGVSSIYSFDKNIYGDQYFNIIQLKQANDNKDGQNTNYGSFWVGNQQNKATKMQQPTSSLMPHMAVSDQIKVLPQFSNTVIGSFIKKSKGNSNIAVAHKSPRNSIKEISGSLNMSHIDSSGNLYIKEAQQIAAVYNDFLNHEKQSDKNPQKDLINKKLKPNTQKNYKIHPQSLRSVQKVQGGRNDPQKNTKQYQQPQNETNSQRKIKFSDQKPKRMSSNIKIRKMKNLNQNGF